MKKDKPIIFEITNKIFWVGIAVSLTITAIFFLSLHFFSQIKFDVIDVVNTFGTLIFVISLFLYSKIFNQNFDKHQEILENEKEKMRYSMNVRKEENDARKLRYSFEITENWHKPEMAKMVNKSKLFLLEWDNYTKENQDDPKEFTKRLNSDVKARTSLIAILNYFEHISILIDEGFADEKAIKKAFSHLFKQYFLKTKRYIEYRQQQENSTTIYMYFLKYAKKWSSD